MWIAIVVLVLGLIGFVDSLYYTLLRYGVLGFHAPLMPIICNHIKGTCEMLAASNWAAILGLPNSIYGMAYYGLIMLASIRRITNGCWPYPRALLLISLIAAMISIYLAGLMIFHLRAICPLCVTVQAINIILAVILLVEIR